ncbi:hypothetical protein CLU79DRAFT_748892 [Phycomyces nitens]|nr:hypothetical protein CLU79DRAFT_748892 [Phycomyces nitens]
MSSTNNDIGPVSENPQKCTNIYKSWTKKDGGKDGLSPIERLQYFMLKNDGRNLEKYLGRKRNGETFKVSKTVLLHKCSLYFQEQGVQRTMPQIKTRLNNLLKQYGKAYYRWEQNDKDVYADQSSSDKREDTERRLNKICPQFFRMKEAIELRVPKTPLDLGNSGSTLLKDNNELENEDSSDGGSDEDLGTTSSDSDSLSLLGSDTARGKKRDLSYTQSTEESKNPKKPSQAVRGIPKGFQSPNLGSLHQNEDEREDRSKLLQYESRVKMVMEMAKHFNWPEKKVEDKLEEYFNKIYTN